MDYLGPRDVVAVADQWGPFFPRGPQIPGGTPACTLSQSRSTPGRKRVPLQGVLSGLAVRGCSPLQAGVFFFTVLLF